MWNLEKTCKRFSRPENILRIRRDLREQHMVDHRDRGRATASKIVRREALSVHSTTKAIRSNHFAVLYRTRIPTSLVGVQVACPRPSSTLSVPPRAHIASTRASQVTLGNESAVSKRVVVASVGPRVADEHVRVGDVLTRVNNDYLPWPTSGAEMTQVLKEDARPWSEWYVWRATPDRNLDAAEVHVRVAPSLRCVLAPMAMSLRPPPLSRSPRLLGTTRAFLSKPPLAS